ncbi:MAG: nucleotidyl transferase AbiEii/AbiGii toxin family protein [Betaproteobacteria bacterium]
MYSRPRHAGVAKVLSALNSAFLGRSKCFFGGGTRVVLELKEYRESADVDFLCADRDGYRALRSTITNAALGEIAARPIALAREVRADQYGIRTIVKVGEDLIKFEIVREARIDLDGMSVKGIQVPCLDRATCFAEKILANDDRWIDESVLSRDIIDLAYMIEAWELDLSWRE